MKKTFILIAISSVAAFFSACGSSYSNRQTVEQMSQPFVCEGLHMKNAKWDFVDDYGLQIHVDGRCHAGRRHGQFNFYSNNEMLAKTKFVKGEEVKTACMIKGKQMSTTLEKCMNIHANEKNRAK